MSAYYYIRHYIIRNETLCAYVHKKSLDEWCWYGTDANEWKKISLEEHSREHKWHFLCALSGLYDVLCVKLIFCTILAVCEVVRAIIASSGGWQ